MSALPLIILGAGGHAKVLLSLAHASGREVIGVCDPGLVKQDIRRWRGLCVLGDDAVLCDYDPSSVELINGIGQLPGMERRKALHEQMTERGFTFATLVHPVSCVDPSVRLSAGVQVMAGAIIQADTTVGFGTIINTGATIDHECRISGDVHIAPGVTICGGVSIGGGAFIGSGATIIQGISIGAGTIIRAGSITTKSHTP